MLINILLLAAIIERIWEHLQQVIGKGMLNLQVKLLGSAILSVAAAISLRLDLLHTLEITAAPTTAGFVLTGFAVSLGSNVVHDLVDIITGLKAMAKPSGFGPLR